MYKAIPKPEAGPITVIVAEKDPTARAALAAMLTDDGYRVFQAANSKEALFQIDSLEHPAVLLVDIDIQGWRSIVQQAISNTGALVISMGKHHFRDISELEGRGIRIHLTKPILYSDVRRAIRERLGAKDAAESKSDPASNVALQTTRKPVLT